MGIRRRITLGLAAIAFGVIATYATAWAAVWWGPIGKVTTSAVFSSLDPNYGDASLNWPSGVETMSNRATNYWGASAIGVRVWRGGTTNAWYGGIVEGVEIDVRQQWLDARTRGEPAAAPFPEWVEQVRAGWPIASIRWTRHLWRLGVVSSDDVWRGAIGTSPRSPLMTLGSSPISRALPLLPLWPQFLANIAIWAFLMSFAAFAFHRLAFNRRSVRRRRLGLCVRCGYDRAGLPAGSGCPECGEAVRFADGDGGGPVR